MGVFAEVRQPNQPMKRQDFDPMLMIQNDPVIRKGYSFVIRIVIHYK